MRRTFTAGRGWAYLGITLGGVVSIAANVAHSYVPPPGAPIGWTPPAGAVVSAFFWPIFLFVALEILARTRWPHGWFWILLRIFGLLPVAIVAGVVSYRHLSGLLGFYGEDPLTATIGPLAVDGLMVVATGALIATGKHRTTHTPHASATVDTLTNPPATQPASEPGTDPGIEAATEPVPPASVDVTPPPAHLLPAARFAVVTHQQTTGRLITADELATRLNIPTPTASRLLAALTAEDTSTATPVVPAAVNGTPVLEAVR
ncbi:MAG TPA: hypothetical protein VFC00_13580 [Micromonosporaceae bacterium]|nr:hypothetical protein [Micromonosporaceae bacterium]